MYVYMYICTVMYIHDTHVHVCVYTRICHICVYIHHIYGILCIYIYIMCVCVYMYTLKILRTRIFILTGTKIQKKSALCDIRLVNETNGFSGPSSSYQQNDEIFLILRTEASLTVHRDDVPLCCFSCLPPLWSLDSALFFLPVLFLLGDSFICLFILCFHCVTLQSVVWERRTGMGGSRNVIFCLAFRIPGFGP